MIAGGGVRTCGSSGCVAAGRKHVKLRACAVAFLGYYAAFFLVIQLTAGFSSFSFFHQNLVGRQRIVILLENLHGEMELCMYSNSRNRGALNRHHDCAPTQAHISNYWEKEPFKIVFKILLLYVMFFICFTCRKNTHPTPSLFGNFISNVCFNNKQKVYKILKHIQGADIIIVYTS